MKRFALLAIAILGLSLSAAAQDDKGYIFTNNNEVKTVPITNQFRSGTCWCFSTLSFLEEEIMRAGGEQMTLSQMWVVRHAYFEKAVKYVRLHGHLNLAVGGAAHDVTEVIKKHGIVPLEVYSGYNYGTTMPEFGEIDAVIKGYMEAVIKNKNGKLTTAWMNGLNAILDAYFGELPTTFEYKGKEYTPKSFAESLPIDINDYVEITSYTHYPFYTTFALEVPDNWMWEKMYNIPIEELMAIVDAALADNRPVAWAADVSEKGFKGNKGIGIVPEDTENIVIGSDAEKWGKLSASEKEAQIYAMNEIVKEKAITQEMRQEAYDRYQTTDDHGMVIVGTATTPDGTKFYHVQNSWGESGPYKGFYYFSRPYVEYKTMDIMVNKNIIPKDIQKKMGLK